MNGSGGIANSAICLAVCGVAPATSQPRTMSQAAKPSQRSRPRGDGIGVGDGIGKFRLSLEFLSRTRNSSMCPGGSSANRRVLSQGGDGLLPPPHVPRDAVNSPGIRYPKEQVKSFRVESRWKASHWSASIHVWVGSYYRLEEAMRAHDTTLHYTRKTPYYYVYPEGYFDPLPAGLGRALPTEEFVTFVKIMAKKFAVDPRKLQRNPLSEAALSRKYVSKKKLSIKRTSAINNDSQSKLGVCGREDEVMLDVQTTSVRSAAANQLPATAVASSGSDARHNSVSSAHSELTSLEALEFISHPAQRFQAPIRFDTSNFDTNISIDDLLEELLSADESTGDDREDELSVLDNAPNTFVLPADAAPPPSTLVPCFDPKVSRLSSSVDFNLAILEEAEFVTHPSQLFPVPKDCNPSIVDMDLSIDEYLEKGDLSADFWMDVNLAKLDDSTLSSFWRDDIHANVVPSFTIHGDAMAMPGPDNPTFGRIAACSEAKILSLKS